MSAAAARYKQAKLDTELAPTVRVNKLKEAIKLWNSCAPSAILASNLGKANALLADLKIPAPSDPSALRAAKTDEHALDPKLRAYHLAESVQCFAAGYQGGKTELGELCLASFASLVALTRTSSLDETLRLEATALRLPAPLQLVAVHKVAEAVYHHGVAALSADGWRVASKAFYEAERPLTRAEELGGLRDACLGPELVELRESLSFHLLIAQGRQAIHVGDQMLKTAVQDEETPDMEAVWNAADRYAEAGLAGRGRDVETEAIAVARRARVYAKVLRSEGLARPLLVHASTLAASLAPRNFHGVSWYDECTQQLRAYQEADWRADEAAEERKKQEERKSQEPARKKMKTEIDALDAFAKANNVYKLLEHVYERYPPKVAAFINKKEEVLKAVKDLNASTVQGFVVKKALLHYHPDKNSADEFGMEWHVMAADISKLLNGAYSRLKGV